MNIGFDAKRAFLNNTGLGNYSRTVIRSLAQYFPENNYTLYTTAMSGSFNSIAKEFPVNIELPSSAPKSLWRSKGITKDLKKDNIQIYHGLSNELPFGIDKSGTASVVTIHDLIFLRYPELYPYIDRKIYYYKSKYACQKANKIIAVSQQTKDDIVHFLDIKEEKIEVVYQSVDAVFHQKKSREEWQKIKTQYNIPDKYILNVGTIEKRKNLMLLVKSLKETDESFSLVIIGRATKYWNEVQQYITQQQLQNRILYIDKIDFKDLPALYQNAAVFVYPSKFEGFGIPVLEAISSCVPVIAATGSCLEEAGGVGSLYIHPEDATALSIALNSVLHNSELRKKMIDDGLQYSELFSRKIIAEKLMRVYQNI